ncbi:Protein casc1 [Boothiomyces sp. JEL0866]|nr:Protein casc1 [Boothiomyces sp. JEL0866]
MPPKKKGKKKDLNREKELEEQRRIAEEEQRLLEEKFRKEKELQEQKNREFITQFLEQEAARFESELGASEAIKTRHMQELKELMDKKQSIVDWNKYLECSKLPSTQIERDVNTYILLWEQEPVVLEDLQQSMDLLMSQLPTARELVSLLEQERCNYLEDDDMVKYEKISVYIYKLLDVMFKKIELVCQNIYQHLDLFQRESTENFQFTSDITDYKIGIWANLTRNPRHKFIDFPDINMSFSLPKPLALDNVGIRMLLKSGEGASATYESTKGGPSVAAIGGVLLFDLVELPEAARKIDSWTLRPVLTQDGSFKRIPYPTKRDAEIAGDEENQTTDLAVWATQVTFTIMPYCFIDNSATVMFFDPELKQWSTDGIKDVEYDSQSGRIRFRTMRFLDTALVQNKYLEYPIQDWNLEPSGYNRAILTIKGRKNELVIEIGEGECKVLNMVNDYHRKLFNEFIPPALLLKKLSQIGLNFLGPKSMNNVDIGDWILKHQKSESMCIEGISQFCAAYQIRRSPQNGSESTNKCIFQCKEVGADPIVTVSESGVETTTEDWKSVIYNNNYKVGEKTFQFAFVTSNSDVSDEANFTVDNASNLKTAADVYTLMKEGLKKGKNIENFKEASPLFKETVLKVFRLTRILVFS